MNWEKKQSFVVGAMIFSGVRRGLKYLMCFGAQRVSRQKIGRELERKCAHGFLNRNGCYPGCHKGEGFWLTITWSLQFYCTSLQSCHHRGAWCKTSKELWWTISGLASTGSGQQFFTFRLLKWARDQLIFVPSLLH